jgi:hypothetical protein
MFLRHRNSPVYNHSGSKTLEIQTPNIKYGLTPCVYAYVEMDIQHYQR